MDLTSTHASAKEKTHEININSPKFLKTKTSKRIIISVSIDTHYDTKEVQGE